MARVVVRPAAAEERRVPTRLHRVGSRPAPMVLVTFAETKVTRAKRGSFMHFIRT